MTEGQEIVACVVLCFVPYLVLRLLIPFIVKKRHHGSH